MLDRFQIRIHHQIEPSNTKRAVLSALARLFDPLGWIAPVVVTAKLIMQRLWAARCDWDEPIPDLLYHEWQTYISQLPGLEAIQIPRQLASGPVRDRSLHGFADASSTAYAAAVYTRSVHQDGRVEVTLLAAKSRVARDIELRNKLAGDGVAWHFLPPTAPHFDGLWEAAVKSVKHHLKRCIGAHTLTYEELLTFLCRVEACLNSRPIAPTSECIDDYSVLTPVHFLIGAPLVAMSEPSVLHLAENRLSS